MAFCRTCGTQIDDVDVYCHVCGASLKLAPNSQVGAIPQLVSVEPVADGFKNDTVPLRLSRQKIPFGFYDHESGLFVDGFYSPLEPDNKKRLLFVVLAIVIPIVVITATVLIILLAG